MRALPLLLPLLLPGLAWGHGGLPAGDAPWLDGDRLVGADLELGLLDFAAGRPTWLSHDAAGVVNQLHRRPDGVVLATTFEGLRRSDDGGCTWLPVDTPAGDVQLRGIVEHPDDPQRLFVSTAGPEANGLLQSTDGGLSWSWLGLREEGVYFRPIVVHGERLLVGGLTASLRDEVRLSEDGGATWREPTGAAASQRGLLLLGVVDDRLWFGERFETGAGALHSSEDGGDTLRFEAGFEVGRPEAYARIGGAGLVLLDGVLLHRESAPGVYELQPGAPRDCLGPVDSTGRLWACGDTDTLGPFHTTTDGLYWEPVLRFDELCPAQCPEGSPGATATEAAWTAQLEFGVGPCLDESPDPEPRGRPADGDGTSSGGCAGTWLPLLLLGLLRLRDTVHRPASGEPWLGKN